MPFQELILGLAALVVAWLIFTWLLKVVKTTLSTALFIALVVLGLLFVGIGPQELLQQVLQIPQQLWQWGTGSGQR
ncbi:hypothetical protein [Geitlerinema sp. PCC 7407]|uniref:hypothetical protein n=1 Tax=Geitlerinema sp. PCC 7407 TaxID=1173025 RepID=UPI00029FB09F|nr:hypothetical protein [Geitlerinema sp. PCC 7407]AFY65744.1 hypothetical protein GEI7407_1250 [Geitlerinema sp. PCC 7407]